MTAEQGAKTARRKPRTVRPRSESRGIGDTAGHKPKLKPEAAIEVLSERLKQPVLEPPQPPANLQLKSRVLKKLADILDEEIGDVLLAIRDDLEAIGG